MKRISAAVIALLLVLPLCACSGTSIYSARSEAQELELVRTTGIDSDGETVSVTVTTGVGIDNSAPRIYRGDGRSLAEAIDGLSKSATGRELNFSHNENLLMAKDPPESSRECLITLRDFRTCGSLRIFTW